MTTAIRWRIALPVLPMRCQFSATRITAPGNPRMTEATPIFGGFQSSIGLAGGPSGAVQAQAPSPLGVGTSGSVLGEAFIRWLTRNRWSRYVKARFRLSFQ